jgi:hypothetical protein
MGNEKRPTTDPPAIEIVEAPTDGKSAETTDRPAADKVGPIARPANGGGRSTGVGRKIRDYVN